eukprot:6183229-Pleurochrysis_carterae.AAC.1
MRPHSYLGVSQQARGRADPTRVNVQALTHLLTFAYSALIPPMLSTPCFSCTNTLRCLRLYIHSSRGRGALRPYGSFHATANDRRSLSHFTPDSRALLIPRAT